jgi:hypothetical protein
VNTHIGITCCVPCEPSLYTWWHSIYQNAIRERNYLGSQHPKKMTAIGSFAGTRLKFRRAVQQDLLDQTQGEV